jgi:hypothetical protein
MFELHKKCGNGRPQPLDREVMMLSASFLDVNNILYAILLVTQVKVYNYVTRVAHIYSHVKKRN